MQFLRNISIVILILANLASAWLVPLIFINFDLRQDYITKVLCVERNKSITVCKGSCYLADQLNNAKEQQEKEKKVNTNEVIFFFQRTVIDVAFSLSRGSIESNYPTIEGHKPSNPHLMGVFNPPRS